MPEGLERMTGDPLYQPLQGRRPKRRRPALLLGATALLVVAGIGVGVAMWKLADKAGEGRSVAIVPIEPLPPQAPSAPPPAKTAANSPPADPTGGAQLLPNGDTVEVQHGVKIIRMAPPRTGMPPGSGDAPGAAPPVAELSPAPDPRLIEHTAAGDLPRIGPGDLRPADIYARPIPAVSIAKASAPRIALVVGDFNGDAAAVENLPADVSVSLRSDLPDVGSKATQIRQAGHEVFLELPPRFGAQVHDASRVIDALHNEMGRFAGYVGVTTPVGTGLPGEARPIIADLSARGLLFLDSATGDETPAPTADRQYTRPDVAIDGRLAKSSIAAAFSQLESVARAKGRAIGYVGNIADANEIASFAASLNSKGLLLVPVSSLVPSLSSGPAAQNNP